MISHKAAKQIQKERETKAILSFAVSAVVIGAAAYLWFAFTDILSISSVFYLVPIAALAFAIKKTRITEFFKPREFAGKVVDVDVYIVKTARVKGKPSYVMNEYPEAEILIEKDGKPKSKVLPHCPLTEHLREGDEVAFLRFIDQPIVISSVNMHLLKFEE